MVDPTEQKILALLKFGPASATAINKAFSGHISKERLQTALGNLETSNKIRVEKQPSKGRPCTMVTLRESGADSS
jgi:predicted ArsR family transcriptional regulator